MSQGEVVKDHCNSCGGVTRHEVLAAKKTEEADCDQRGNEFLLASDNYEMLECRGCESVTLRHTSYFAGDTTVTHYPPPVSRRLPGWTPKLPEKIRGLLEEVYVALQNNSRRLAAMGARALLDSVMIDTVGDLGNFKEKLQAMEERGTISKVNRQTLEAALDAGSAAAHRGHRASSDEVNAVMDIVENLLQAVYHLPNLADRLKKVTPPRLPSPGS